MVEEKIGVMDNISSELRRKRITEKEFRDVMGITPSTYKTWRKNNNLPVAQLVKCAKIFDCTLEYLTRDVTV